MTEQLYIHLDTRDQLVRRSNANEVDRGRFRVPRDRYLLWTYLNAYIREFSLSLHM